MWKFLCKIFGCQYTRHSFWHDRLKVNIPNYRCIFCGKESKWSKSEKAHFEKHACDKCGAWVCDSGVCTYC